MVAFSFHSGRSSRGAGFQILPPLVFENKKSTKRITWYLVVEQVVRKMNRKNVRDIPSLNIELLRFVYPAHVHQGILLFCKP